jgi:diguanylate cyclase (GGDEF)-like protein
MVSIAAVALIWLSAHERRLRREALIDPLTGVFNRRSFMEFSVREEARANRGGNTFAVLMVDIDHFKRVNDTYGHPAGDTVIRELAAVASRTLRPSDILARYGGEEFVVSLPDTNQEQAQIVAERLRHAIEATAVIGDAGAIRFTISIGVAICSHDTPLKDAIVRADQALYAAKRNGRNRVELSQSPDTSKAAAPSSAAPPLVSMGRAARGILVVDDDREIRDLLAECLRGNGYAVETVANAADALRVIETDPTVALLFTDVVMPGGMDGFVLGTRAEAIRPDLKVLYMSGYAAPAAASATSGKAIHLLRKPFRLSQVLESIAVALNR